MLAMNMSHSIHKHKYTNIFTGVIVTISCFLISGDLPNNVGIANSAMAALDDGQPLIGMSMILCLNLTSVWQ